MQPDLVIIPTYNERENVRALVPEIVRVRPDARIWIVDDNSPDGTAEEVRALSREFPQVALILRQKKEGLGRAYTDALTRAKKENFRAVLLMDADGSHDAKYAPMLLDKIPEFGIVVGSRYVKGGDTPGWEKWRRMLSSGGNMYARALTGLPVNDITAGFYAIRKDVLDNIDLGTISAAGYAFQIQLKYRAILIANARALEIPIVFRERREGESKLSRHIILEGISAPLWLFFDRLRRNRR
jgi:dolichol-phosphate mannosyltransferase